MALFQNLVSHEFTTTDEQEILAAVNTLRDKLSFVQGIDAIATTKTSSMDVANKAFVDDAYAICIGSNNADIIGNLVDVLEFGKDVTLFTSLDRLERELTTVIQEVQRAKRAAGGDSYNIARRVYDLVKLARKSGVAGAETAYQKLFARYSRMRKSKTV